MYNNHVSVFAVTGGGIGECSWRNIGPNTVILIYLLTCLLKPWLHVK